MDRDDVNRIVQAGQDSGERPNLRCANLRCVDLRDANLRCVDLRYADLRRADLRCADLRRADLRCVDLRCADLRCADLRRADLRCVDLRCANLREALLPPTDAILASPWGWCHIQREHIRIGCQYHTSAEWAGSSDQAIAVMADNALEWWRQWKPAVLALAEACDPYEACRETEEVLMANAEHEARL